MAFAMRVKVPPNSASLQEARHRTFDFFRAACRSIPSIMDISNPKFSMISQTRMLTLGVQIQRPLLAPSRCCLRTNCSFSSSSYPNDQVLQHVDQQFDDLLTWLREKGGPQFGSVLTVGNSNYGRSLFAGKRLRRGECILRIPYSVQLFPEDLHPSVDSLLGEDIDDIARLALVIIQEKKLGQASEWAPYIRCLPRVTDMHSTIFWSDEELEMIKTSSLYHETLKHKASIKKDFSSIKHALDQFPEYFEGVTLNEFKHAYNLVESRAWNNHWGPFMMPFADFLNHDTRSGSSYNTGSGSSSNNDIEQVSLVFSSKNYALGDEVFSRYESLSNAELLMIYGFIIYNNKFDQVKVVVSLPQHDHLHALKLDLLHKHAILSPDDVNELRSQENGFITMDVKSYIDEDCGISESLRALARVLCCTSSQELQDLEKEATQNSGFLTRLPLKNRDREVEAHQFLHSELSHMIEGYYTTLESLTHDSTEKSMPRMQLARGLLTGELQILEPACAWLKNYYETLKQT